jgi:hypothetical protein
MVQRAIPRKTRNKNAKKYILKQQWLSLTKAKDKRPQESSKRLVFVSASNTMLACQLVFLMIFMDDTANPRFAKTDPDFKTRQ